MYYTPSYIYGIYFLGCSKCHKEFTRENFNDKPDHPKRFGVEHKRQALEIMQQKTKTSVREKKSEYGVRYSQLFRLPYFDPIPCHAIDPMHNLLLGIAKHTFVTWVETGVLSEDKLLILDTKIAKLKLPTDINRIFKNISSTYKTLKAEQWKHWILNYSTYCVFNVLPNEHFIMWKLFVLSCLKILKRTITEKEVNEAHTLLLLFCKKYTDLFGKEHWTPNMHLSLHLKECLLDFGPVYGWWCMAFKCLMGYLVHI